MRIQRIKDAHNILIQYVLSILKLLYMISEENTPKALCTCGSSALRISAQCTAEHGMNTKTFKESFFDSLRSKKAILNIWVHNLAYEFQFLRGIYDFQPEDVFLLDRRMPLRAQTGRALYRCSYKQTNMGLAEFTKKMKAKHQKLSGDDFDYKSKDFHGHR